MSMDVKDATVYIAAEFEYLRTFVQTSCFDEEICRDQLRILWTAFCLHYGMSVDTNIYDRYALVLWDLLQEAGDGTAEWKDFNTFDNFMCKYLV